jgi:hypothetical protein
MRTEEIKEYDNAREQPIKPGDIVFILKTYVRAPVIEVRDDGTVVVDLGNFDHLVLKPEDAMKVPEFKTSHVY